ncbi:GGDEF domain-containing protein [Brevibacillus choshinensis]|nr:GGDEF domain-containing protein [Brevibacillus choshinensis]
MSKTVTPNSLNSFTRNSSNGPGSSRNKRLIQLETEVSIDGLTHLANRKAFDHTIEDWLKNGTPFSLILLDIDYFKRFNDTYGHVKGDEVLPVELVACADQALYHSKENRRNRTTMYQTVEARSSLIKSNKRDSGTYAKSLSYFRNLLFPFCSMSISCVFFP